MLDILLVDDEPELLSLLEEQLTDAGYRVQTATDGDGVAARLRDQTFDVVICDVRLPRTDGLSLLRHLRKETPSTDVILMTAYSEVAQAVSALKEGAYDYLTKPFDVDELLLQVGRIGENRRLRRELESARGELCERNQLSLIGQSTGIRRVRELISVVSQSDAPVMVTGESGTGKEVVARLIHQSSPRRERPFVAVNCGALAENLIEAELFGHERGAFTGAVRKRDGRFKAADGGTLLLDEVAELPLSAQAKLLRVLQEGTFEPLGTNTPIKVDVRIISATHRNLSERIKTGAFREDLYYRINVIEIKNPTLRERPADLPLLLRHFIQRLTPSGEPLTTVSRAAWTALAGYPFPGNVRELSHAVEHALVLSGGGEIDVAHLPASIVGSETTLRVERDDAAPILRPLHAAMRDFEHDYLLRALKATDGKRTRTAELLGISRKTLWEKLRSDSTNGGRHPDDDGPAVARGVA